jgi:uncharacterized protein (TIGR00290 family)
MPLPRAYVSWSSGKDSAWALQVARAEGLADVAGLLTTVDTTHRRVAMHAVRRELLHAQAAALALPLVEVELPWPCPNGAYEAAMAAALSRLRGDGVTHLVFGDLFLEDIRAYRDAQLAALGVTPIYPLWRRDTRALAREVVDGGLRATLTCVDPAQLDASFAGRRFDAALLAELPAGVDPCGERGEFHTFAWAGPMFPSPLAVRAGEVVLRDGFAFADLLPLGG